MDLKGSKTEQNLKDAFAGESQANRRYLYFASKADVEGYNDVSAVFRSTAEGETGHAHGHLEYLEAVGDPATGLPIGATGDNLKAAIAGETHEYTDMYPGMAKSAPTRVSTRSPIGLRPWPKRSALTPTVSRKLWTVWTANTPQKQGGRAALRGYP
jgi:rubrerythrin